MLIASRRRRAAAVPNSGSVRRTDVFELVSIRRVGGIAAANCMEEYAYRPAMGSTNMASASYSASGEYPYLYRCTNVSHRPRSSERCHGCNEPGHDYRSIQKGPRMTSVDNCSAACTQDRRCRAWTYNPELEPPTPACYLKGGIAPAMDCTRPPEVSGCSTNVPPGVSMPQTVFVLCNTGTGMRSALPLGTFGQTVELRVDGTLADWRGIWNNGPEGNERPGGQQLIPAAKVYVEQAVFALWTNVTGLKVLRTHRRLSPSGCRRTEYSGSFPHAAVWIRRYQSALQLPGTSQFSLGRVAK